MLLCWMSFFSLLLMLPPSYCENPSSNGIRHRRFVPPLIFLPTAPTRTQWIAGIGIPLEDLVFEAMTTGYVFKAEYFLPSTAEQLRNRTSTNIAGRRRRRRHESDMSTIFEQNFVNESELKSSILMEKKVLSGYRWSIYKALEGLANRLGLSGRSCVLKSICEAAVISFHYKNGILGELMHILLSPSCSADELSEHADNEYFQAENFGRSGASCERIFHECSRSLLDHFSNIHTLTKDLTMLLNT